MNYNNYNYNIRLERKFAKQIKMILALTLIGQDSRMDKEEATDFMILRSNPFKIACRLRTYKFYQNLEFTNQFTIRCSLTSGKETELDKIRKGFADYIFYGFVDEKEEKIIKYFIGDLDIFRDYEGGMRVKIYENKDENPSKLAVYNLVEFPVKFIIKKYGYN